MSPFLSALRCFFLVCQHHAIEVSPERFRSAKEEDITGSVLHLMHEVGLKGKFLRRRKWRDLEALDPTTNPIMVEQQSGHWIIVAGITPKAKGTDGESDLAIMDPRTEQAGLSLIPRKQFEAEWNGNILVSKLGYDLENKSRSFGLRWFMPEIMGQRKYFRDIIIAATLANLLSFITPLSFQIMLDKVVPHQSYQTLFTLTIILVVATLFDALFGYVRQILMLYATNKIDARIITQTFEHLMRLPMPFFEGTSTGVLIHNMQQTEGIRGFLTGRLFQSLLDASAVPLLLVALTLYSVKLTLVVLAFTVTLSAIIGFMIPLIRKQLELLFGAEGSRQSDLVESIHNMRAVKSMALEPIQRVSWRKKVASCITYRTTVGRLNAIAAIVTEALKGLMTLTILSLGILEVFDGNLSLGALVAFNMMSGRVSEPLLQIVSLISEYQQTALAINILGNIMNHPPERDPNQRGIQPPIAGQITFDQVTFSYNKSVTPALNHVSFTVQEGQMIGVVGRSGSGKTTVTRLIQNIHTPQEGSIFLDGHDIGDIDLPHLRRNIGVVLQDNILFTGSIQENIAAARPDATLSEVIEAAQLAGADEFIDRLPHSYETYVEESGSNFSGGQRQRIAIARALLLSPSLLIFDEATSALDPDSEAIIRKSLAKISEGRTMIIISHRLSSLVTTDAIMVLDRGEVVDFAPHEVLLGRCEIYQLLWNQQNSF